MSLRPRLTRDAGDGGAAWDVERAAAAQGNGAPNGADAAAMRGSAAQVASPAPDARSGFTQNAPYAESAPFSAAQDASPASDARSGFTQDSAYAEGAPFSAAQDASPAPDVRSGFTQNAPYAESAPFSAAQAASPAPDAQSGFTQDSARTTDAQPAPAEAPPILRHSVETYATERPSELYGHRRVVRDGRMPPASQKPNTSSSVAPSAERYGIPDNPFAPQGEGQPRRRSRVARTQNAEASAAQPAAPTASPLVTERGIPPRAPWSGAGAVSYAPNDTFRANRSQTTFSQAPARRFAPSVSASPTNNRTFAPQVDSQTAGASVPADASGASFAPPQSPHSPATAAPSQAQVFVTRDGSQFEAPARPEVPDWLRVAQQNNLPLRRPQGPRVTAAPRPSDDDTAPQLDPLGRPLHRPARHAGASVPQPTTYPIDDTAPQPDPLGRPLHRPARHAGASVPQPTTYPFDDTAPQLDPPGRPLHRPARHAGASASHAPADPLSPASLQQRARSYAKAPADAPQTSSQADNPPPATFQRAARPRPASDEPHAPTRRPRLVWMAVAVFLAASVAVGLWLAQLSFRGQTQGVLDARQAAYDAVVEAHPLRYQALIEEKAGKYNLSPAFVAAIVLNESSFRPDATSSVGARGLMQLVDKTASWVHDKLNLSTPYSFDALYEPETNVEYGCWYLSFLCSRFRGDPILVAAAYHAGQGEVQNWLNDSRYSDDSLTIELENMMDGPTKQYTARVVSDYAVYKRLYYPSTEDTP